jgi:D-alanyl-D-alanine carboxypeptidase (penicillin-binding protein 5/6)
LLKHILSFTAAFALLCALPFVCSAQPDVSAEGAILISAGSGRVIAAYNERERLPMASTTKIMTALLLAECGDLSKEIVTTREMVTVEGSSMGLLSGDRVTYHDLLYGMLLASGNDAANTTAICLGGSTAGFAELMNVRAAELGLTDTHFVTPSGLDDPEHYTTAYDLARLAAFAMQNPLFREAAGAKTAALCYGNPPYRRTLTNHNKLLSFYDGCIGVKTGFTKKSGRCLVSAAEREGATLIAVTLNDGNDWADHAALLDYGFSLVETREVSADLPGTVQVAGGTKTTAVCTAEGATLTLLPEEFDLVETEVYLDSICFAPVEAGTPLGRVEYRVGENLLATREIIAAETVPAAAAQPVKKTTVWDALRRLLQM